MTDPPPPEQPDAAEAGTADRPTGLARAVRPAIIAAVLGFAVHLLLPQVAELEQGIQALRTGRWSFLLVSLAGTVLAFVASAWMVRASVERPPGWLRTTLTQVAASAAAALTPLGVGWAVVTQSHLHKSGTDEPTAQAATAFNMAMTVVGHVALLLLLVPFLGTLHLPTIAPPPRRVFVDAFGILAVVTGILFWAPRLRRKATSIAKPILSAMPRVIGDPRRATTLVVAAVATNVAFAVALYGSVSAFGPNSHPFEMLIAYLVGATAASIAPTPGGLGAAETALVAALTRLGVPAGQAVAATLTFRVITFWLPLAVGSVLLRQARRWEWV